MSESRWLAAEVSGVSEVPHTGLQRSPSTLFGWLEARESWSGGWGGDWRWVGRGLCVTDHRRLHDDSPAFFLMLGTSWGGGEGGVKEGGGVFLAVI